jgi:hypothetical protein
MSVIIADNGMILPIESLPKTLTYAGTILSAVTVQYAGKTYVRTYQNNGVNITEESRWEVQP